MSDDRWQQLIDLVEKQERDLSVLRAEVQKLQGFDLGHTLFMRALMTAMVERGVFRADDMPILIQQLIAATEKSGTSGIRTHAVDRLKRLQSTSLLDPKVHKPTRQ